MPYIPSKNLRDAANDPNLEIYKFPNHTQAVQRTVKMVTASSVKVCGVAARDGYLNYVNFKTYSSNYKYKIGFS